MEVLNTYTQLTEGADFIMVVFIVPIIIFAIATAVNLDSKDFKTAKITGIITIALLLTIVLKYPNLNRDTFHNVIINNVENFDYENYKIISSEGKIITIKEVK